MFHGELAELDTMRKPLLPHPLAIMMLVRDCATLASDQDSKAGIVV